MSADQFAGYTPQPSDSLARTLRSNEELQFGRHSQRSSRSRRQNSTTEDASTVPGQHPDVPTQNFPQTSTPHSQALRSSQNLSPPFDGLLPSGTLHRDDIHDEHHKNYQNLPPNTSHKENTYNEYDENYLNLFGTNYQDNSKIVDSHKLVEELQEMIFSLELQMKMSHDHVKEESQRLTEKYKDKEDELSYAIDLLSQESHRINGENTELAKSLANVRVALNTQIKENKRLKDLLDANDKDLNVKLKKMSEEKIRDKSELSGLKVRFNDQKKFNAEQKEKIEKLEAENKKLKEANMKVTTTVTQLRLQNQGLQQSLNTARTDNDLNAMATTRRSSSFANYSSAASNRSNLASRPATETRQSSSAASSRPTTSSLRFSNRTQVRDISPIQLASMVEQERPESPQGIESEIHTASCRYNCHLFEHEGDEGRFRWVCGMNERIIVMYREQRYVIFVPDAAEIQFFGEGSNQGQTIIFWAGEDESNKEITVCRTNGMREEYRVDEDGNIIFREVFNFDGSAFRIGGDNEGVAIDVEEETPLVCEAKTTLNGPNDVQVHHENFALRLINYEFMRIQIPKERLQITMCLCENKRVFNVKHCSPGFESKALCTFLGQCPNMQIR